MPLCHNRFYFICDIFIHILTCKHKNIKNINKKAWGKFQFKKKNNFTLFSFLFPNFFHSHHLLLLWMGSKIFQAVLIHNQNISVFNSIQFNHLSQVTYGIFLHWKYEHTHSMIYYTQKYNIYLKILLLKFLLFCLQQILLNYILNISRVLIYFSTLSCLFYVAKIIFLLTRNSSDCIPKKLWLDQWTTLRLISH